MKPGDMLVWAIAALFAALCLAYIAQFVGGVVRRIRGDEGDR